MVLITAIASMVIASFLSPDEFWSRILASLLRLWAAMFFGYWLGMKEGYKKGFYKGQAFEMKRSLSELISKQYRKTTVIDITPSNN